MTENEARICAKHAHDFAEGFMMTLEFLTGRVRYPEPYSEDHKREAGDWLHHMTVSAEMLEYYHKRAAKP